MGYSSKGLKESDTTEVTYHAHAHRMCHLKKHTWYPFFPLHLVVWWNTDLVDILVDLHMGLALQLSTKPILAGFKHPTFTYSHLCASVLVPSPGMQNYY